MLLFLLAAQVWDPASPARLEAPLREAVALREQMSGKTSPEYAEAMSQLARFLASQKRREEALAHFRVALSIRETAADLESAAGLDPANAEELLRRAASLAKQPRQKSRILRSLAAILEARNDIKGADGAYRQALETARAAGPADFGVAANDLGVFVENQGDMRAAESLYRQALAAFEKAHGPRHPEVGTTAGNLAGAVGAQGRLAEAETLLRRAVSVLEAAVGRRHGRTAAVYENFGDLLAATGRTTEARRMFQSAVEAYRATGDSASAAAVERRSAALH